MSGVRRGQYPRTCTKQGLVVSTRVCSALPTGCTTLAPVGGPDTALTLSDAQYHTSRPLVPRAIS